MSASYPISVAKKREMLTVYTDKRHKKIIFLLFLSLLLLLLAGYALIIGSVDLTLVDAYSVILAKFVPFGYTPSSLSDAIIWDIRLPRVIMAILVGTGLALTGAVMQGVLQNPLAEPFTLGISSAAAAGAAIAIVTGVGIIGGPFLIIGNSFIFAMGATMLVYSLARCRGMTPESLILAGIAVMFFLNAITSIAQYLGTPDEVETIVFWIMGNLGKSTWSAITAVFILLLLGIPVLLRKAPDINIINGGDETAKSLGIHVERTRILCMVLSALITAGITAFTGIIGFIGLIAPHLIRMILGGDNRYVFPGSALMGAIILLGADTVARTIFSPIILPVGVMTSVLGVPFFLFLFLRQKKGMWQ